jgi:DNA polymerase type B, organellar and viral
MKTHERTLVSYDALDRRRRRLEQERIRKARTRYRWIDTRRSHHEDRRFVGWDGEGPRDAGYALFGNSDGDEICEPFLPTNRCLDLIIAHKRRNPNTISVWFGGDYDVSNILTDLPRRNMAALHEYSKTVWLDYELEHIPHKWFKVKHGEISVTIFDIHSFFDSNYATALDSWEIGTPEQREAIKKGKADRPEFLWRDILEIRDYFRLELQLMPPLCDKLRDIFADAGYVPRSWHGPGALARMALSRHNVYAAMAVAPGPVGEAARSAFAGGRFELTYAGHFKQRIYNYDIHSAYPFFATGLPNLAKGRWRRSSSFEPGKFGVYRIRYEAANPDSFDLYPLFRRLPGSGVAWPYRVTGWYWTPEAEIVKEDEAATFLDGWIFDEDDETDRPFAWLSEYYLRRQRLKNNGSAAEYTFKLIINAVYGQLAQRVGWNRKDGTAPKTHQIEWAGYITSACRAAVYTAGRAAGSKLVSIDTDGLYSLCPIEFLDVGENLGQWELTEYEDGIFWQSGVYCLKTENGWVKAKTRGIPKGTYTAEDLIERVKTREPFAVVKNVFTGYRLADNGQWDKRNTWEEKRHEYVFGGSGKRSHLGRFGACNDHCSGDIHALGSLQFLYGPEGSPDSKPHYLPWLDNEQEMADAKAGHFALDTSTDPESEEMGWMKAPMKWPPEWQQSSPIRIRQKTKAVSAVGPLTAIRKKLGSRFSSH